MPLTGVINYFCIYYIIGDNVNLRYYVIGRYYTIGNYIIGCNTGRYGIVR